MPCILLASGNHLCSNPRVVKEADALSAAGFEVHVLGGAYLQESKERDHKLAAGRAWRHHLAYDLTASTSRRLMLKVRRRAGLLVWNRFGIANRWQIFYGTGELQRAVARFNADLTIAHWEAALSAACHQMRRSKRVGIDMEDWFSEDLLPSARESRPIAMLASQEAELLSKGVHTTCTSEAMADALVTRYGCRRPVVVRNVFPVSDRRSIDERWLDRPHMVKFSPVNRPQEIRPSDAPVSIHWFSQTIGPGRGLKDLLQAARGLAGNFEIHLRGEGDSYGDWLREMSGSALGQRLHVHGPSDNNMLLARIAEHDVGFCGEPVKPPNKNLTISNKLFQYLQGGLAVVASATAGQKEGAKEAPDAVLLYQSGDVDGLKQTLQRLIDDRAKLRAMRTAAWQAGGRLCWENEAPKLVESVLNALSLKH